MTTMTTKKQPYSMMKRTNSNPKRGLNLKTKRNVGVAVADFVVDCDDCGCDDYYDDSIVVAADGVAVIAGVVVFSDDDDAVGDAVNDVVDFVLLVLVADLLLRPDFVVDSNVAVLIDVYDG